MQGFNTVVVRTRVDGQIDKIAFKEGQLVNQGDLLVEIDPRPYQATLDQAKAKKAQDEANLANANLDLQRYTKLGEFATRQQTDTQRSTVAQLTAQISADDAAIFNAQTQLDYTQVKSPISGVAGLRQVDIGNIVNAVDANRHRDDRPDRADRRHLHRAGRPAALHQRGAVGTAARRSIALTTDGKKTLSEGTLSVVNNQVDTDQRHHSPQGGVRQQGPRAVAGPVGLDPAAGDDAEGRDRGSGRRGSARNRRPLCLRGQLGQQGRAAQDQGSQSIDGRSVVDEGLSPGEQVIMAGQYKVQPGSLVATAVASSRASPGQGDQPE